MARTLSILALIGMFMLPGCLYSHVTLPYSTDLNKTDLGHKKGEASTYSVLWLVAWGNAGSAAAAQSGGITTLNHMDQELLVVLFGLYMRHTTIVYGH